MCATANKSFKVMSFNMKRNYFSFGKNSWEKRAALVAQVIRQNSPDIMGTQELTTVSLSDMQRLLPEYSYVGQGRGGGMSGVMAAVAAAREQRRVLLIERGFMLGGMATSGLVQPITCWGRNIPDGVKYVIGGTGREFLKMMHSGFY